MKTTKEMIKKAGTSVLIFAMSLSLFACSGGKSRKDKDEDEEEEELEIDEYSEKDIIDVLKENDFKKSDINHYDDSKDYTYFYAENRSVYVMYYYYDDEDDARDMFDRYYDEYKDVKKSGNFEGDLDADYTDDAGYVFYNGEYDDKKDKWTRYGGIYYSDNMVFCIFTDRLKDRTKDNINNVLEDLGYPVP